jgi:hypothetical protein
MSDGYLHLIYADYLIRGRISRGKSAAVRGTVGWTLNGVVDAVNCNAVNAIDNFCMKIKNKI